MKHIVLILTALIAGIGSAISLAFDPPHDPLEHPSYLPEE